MAATGSLKCKQLFVINIIKSNRVNYIERFSLF